MTEIERLKSWLKFNSSRERLHQANSTFSKSVKEGALILDAGSGQAPYKHMFKHAQYESADFLAVEKCYAKPTYVCDLKDIPTEPSRFDYIIFNQVLEHVPEPKLVLEELNRVLKVGGEVLYSGPLFYEEHEQPYDFYRYTQYGLAYLFEQSGFRIKKLEWLEGYFGTVAYQLNGMARHLPYRPEQLGHSPLRYILLPALVLLKAIFGLLSIMFHRMEKQIKFTQAGYPKNYLAIVQKIENVK